MTLAMKIHLNLGKWFNMQKSPIVWRRTITSFLVCSSCMGVVVILIISIHNFFHSDNSIKSQPTFLLGWQPTIRVCQLIFTDSAPRLIQSIGLNVCLCVCPLLWDPETCGLETSGQSICRLNWKFMFYWDFHFEFYIFFTLFWIIICNV